MKFKDNRFGVFSLSVELLNSMTDNELHFLFCNFVIFKAEHNFACNYIEYQAYSELFNILENSNILPEYIIESVVDELSPLIKATIVS